MSKILIDPQLERLTRSLSYSGTVWSDRLEASQQPLARQVAALLPDPAATLSQIGDWMNGKPTDTAFHAWSFKPADVFVQGPELRGHNQPFRTPAFRTATLTDFERNHPYLTAAGTVIETEAGDAESLPEELELHEQTVWFLPTPDKFHPVLLITESGPLVEGSGFLCVGSWLMFYEDPNELWPDRVIAARCRRRARSCRSTALAADRLYTAGREIALYRRQTQSLKQFERALCEVAGLPLLETEGLITRIDTRGNGSLHWLDDGRSFLLPGASPYTIGTRVDAGDGHLLKIRHQSLQGTDWWRARPWIADGVPIFVFRPGFYGFALKDEMVTAVAYEDEEGDLRARLILNQEGEDLFWEWQARQERSLPPGVSTLAEILGLEVAGETTQVNALGFFVTLYGPWFGVIETSLDVVDPAAFRALLDFVERERPAGSIYFVRGESEAFRDERLFSVYLNTGELVYTESDILMMPAAY